MITYNGAVVLSGTDSSVIQRRLIERSAFEALVKFCRTRGLRPLAYACGAELDFMPRETVYTEGAAPAGRDLNGAAIQNVPDLLAVRDDFVAVLIDSAANGAGADLMAELSLALAGQARVTTSGGSSIEICHPLGTKLNAMAELARVREIELRQIMAIGDNFNDVEMIQCAGVGVAVANAPEAVQRVAALRTTLPSSQGVVQALRALTRAVRSWPHPEHLAG